MIRLIGQCCIGLILCAGLLVGGLRLAAASAGFFKDEIASWLSEALLPEISFAEIQIYWRGSNPVLEMKKVALTLPDRSQPVLIEALVIDLNLLDSISSNTLVMAEVSGKIEKVILRKDSQKRWWFSDIELMALQDHDSTIDFRALLVSVPYLRLELEHLIIADESEQQVYDIGASKIDIRQHGAALHLQLQSRLPEALGETLTFQAIVTAEQSTAYLQAHKVNLRPIAALLGMPTGGLQQAETTVALWVDLTEQDVETVAAHIVVDQGQYQRTAQDPMLAFGLALELNAVKMGDTWLLSQHIEDLLVNRQEFSAFDAKIRLSSQANTTKIDGWLDTLEIAHYFDLGKFYLATTSGDSVPVYDPQGRLEDIRFSLLANDWSSLMFMGHVKQLSTQAGDDIPGLDPINGDFLYAAEKAEFKFSAEQLSVDFAGGFRSALQFDHLQATLYAQMGAAGMRISVPAFSLTNADIQTDGRLWLEIDPAAGAFLYLRAQFDQADLSQKSKYLPVELLPKKVLEWLDAGIISGTASNGNLLFHGRLEKMATLTKRQAGEFHVEFNIEDTEIMFDPNWARVINGSGSVAFHNMGFDIKIDQASYAGIDAVQMKVGLEDYGMSDLSLEVDAQTSTEQALRSWLAMPIGAKFRQVASNFQDPEGKIKAKIELSVPLRGDPSSKTQAQVHLSVNDAAIRASDWGVQLSSINGNLWVTDQTLFADDITAEFFGDPVTIAVQTDAVRQQTLIQTQGVLETRQLLSLLPQQYTQSLSGKSRWQIDLRIANQPKAGEEVLVTIDASSDLQRTSIDFPRPYGKQLEAKMPVSAQLQFLANGGIQLHANYASQLRTRGRFNATEAGNLELKNLDVSFSEPLKAKAKGGIRLYGSLPELSLDEWIAHLQSQYGSDGGQGGKLLFAIETADLSLKSVQFRGQPVVDNHLILVRTPHGMSGRIDSPIIKGDFEWPEQDTAENPVVVNLDYLKIAPQSGDNKNDLMPSDFFNLRFRSQLMSYGDYQVTDVDLNTRQDGNLLLIDGLAFKYRKIELLSKGYWLYSPVTIQHESLFQLTVKGKEFGESLSALGFGDIIGNGSIDFEGEFSWPEKLFEPSWATISGKGKFDLEDGVLRNLEPGSGRLIGLLSISSLQRRLGADFSDVLFQGLEFDDIEGHFVLDGHYLYTNDTELDGVAVSIRVNGKSNLRDRIYDQTLHVVPKIRKTLPIIGAATISGPVGWFLLAFQDLFQSVIDDSVESRYSITGSWDDPVVTSLEKPKPKPSIKRERRAEK